MIFFFFPLKDQIHEKHIIVLDVFLICDNSSQ
jgi:hypothetical protein